jgi:hypothetical protein
VKTLGPVLLALAALTLAAGPSLAACPAGAPLGLFKGANEASGADRIEVILNLVCANGAYLAELFTSQSDLKVTETAGSADAVRLAFEGFSGPGAASLQLSGERLSGVFNVGLDKGALNLTRSGPPLAPGSQAPTLKLTTAQWREDLAALATELPRRHANAFYRLPKAKFEAQVAALDRRLPKLDGDQAFVALEQLANAIGDGHTGVIFPPDRRILPLQFARFGADIRVVAAGPGFDRALGARVERIGKTPIADAWRLALTLTPQDELMPLREGRALSYLRSGMLLHGLGVITERDHATLTLRSDAGRPFTVALQGAEPGLAPPLAPTVRGEGLAQRNPGKAFWCEDLPLQQAVYCDFRAYQNIGRAALDLFALIDKSHPKKLIIDMRENGGGDNTLGYGLLIRPLKVHADINRKGGLYVLVGAQTFSAAMNNAAQFQDETQAILVGEPIGEKPNSYQEPRQFRLPNSHLIVRASSLYYEFRKHGPNVVAPDKTITPTWADVKAGRDPVLDWVLAQPAPN